MCNIIIWVADVGSITKNRFGWCRKEVEGDAVTVGQDIKCFTEGIAEDMSLGRRVALGFECPLFVPVTDEPQGLTKARHGEGNRPWSAGAGAGALAVGLSESVWVLTRINMLSLIPVQVTLNWDDFYRGDKNLFIWEAFVSRNEKGVSDCDDALIAANSFSRYFPKIQCASCVEAENPFSLIGAAIVRSGLAKDTTLLSQPVVVIK